MARTYAKVSPQFWTGDTGRQIRELGREAQVVALYLLTCPGANMIGLYYLPVPTLAHETGVGMEGAARALERLAGVDFAHYDGEREIVWVPEMARHQLGEVLHPRDRMHVYMVREVERYRRSIFYPAFIAAYRERFALPESLVAAAAAADVQPPPPAAQAKPSASPPEALAKGFTHGDGEGDREGAGDGGGGTGGRRPPPVAAPPKRRPPPASCTFDFLEADLTDRQRDALAALREAVFYVPGRGDLTVAAALGDEARLLKLAGQLGGPGYPRVDPGPLIHRLATWTQNNKPEAKRELGRFLTRNFAREQDRPTRRGPAEEAAPAAAYPFTQPLNRRRRPPDGGDA
jgi:hypothetical protein